jgi:hypothetical protein
LLLLLAGGFVLLLLLLVGGFVLLEGAVDEAQLHAAEHSSSVAYTPTSV